MENLKREMAKMKVEMEERMQEMMKDKKEMERKLGKVDAEVKDAIWVSEYKIGLREMDINKGGWEFIYFIPTVFILIFNRKSECENRKVAGRGGEVASEESKSGN